MMAKRKWGKNNIVSSYKKQCSLFCILLMLISATMSGCQQKKDGSELLLESDQLSTVESLYGKDQSAALEGLQLEESDISQETIPGEWNLAEPVLIEGKEFSETLFYEVSTETFYGMRFMNRFEDAEELSGYVEDVLEKANDIYGEPSTYPGLPNRLMSETFSSDFSEAMKSGSLSDWKEEWSVGEKTRCTLLVTVVDTNTASLSLEYIIAR